MNAQSLRDDVVREPADWMQPLDNRILETLRDEGNLTPNAIDSLGVTSRSQASRRCSKLARAGILERVGGDTSVYRLTEKAHGYLNEETSLADVPNPDDDSE